MNKTSLQKYGWLLLPFIMVLMQGLYRNVQCVVAIFLMLILLRKATLSAKQGVCLAVVFVGLLLSDVLTGGGITFIYEGLKVCLLFLGTSVPKEERKTVAFGAYLAISLSSVLGIIAYIFKIQFYEFTYTVDDSFVLQGIFGYANTMALFCGIGVFASAYYVRQNEKCKVLHKCFFVVNSISFILTKSLFGFVCLAAAVILAVFIRYRKSRKVILVLGIVMLLGVLSLFFCGREEILLRSTVASRLIYWHDALHLLLKHPFGIGVHKWLGVQGAVQTADYSVKYVHNGFIQLLLDGGILALLAFVSFLVIGYKDLIRKYTVAGERRYLYRILVLTFVLMHSFVDSHFAYGLVWFVVGFLFGRITDGKILQTGIAVPVIVLSLAVATVIVPEREYVNEYAFDFDQAYYDNDLEDMDKISALWLAHTPRQQAAYDARYYALAMLGDEDGLHELQKQKEEINSTMNVLCKYLSKHREIVLPEMETK